MPRDPDHAYFSMGHDLFDCDLLAKVLEEDAAQPGTHDGGRDVIPSLMKGHRVMAYNFCDNMVTGRLTRNEALGETSGRWTPTGRRIWIC